MVLICALSVLTINEQEVIANLNLLGEGSYYWSLPEEFLGNKLTAYGG